jgi:hypothetical protein
MRLLPLILSAHAASWVSSDWQGSGFRNSGSQGSCRFCGLDAASWREPFHLNGDHADESAENIVPACVLCHLAQHLGRPGIEKEAVLIWLPEISQGAVNAIVRATHLIRMAHGDSPHMEMRPRSTAPQAQAAFSAYMELRDRSKAVFARLGTASPRDLGEALVRLRAEPYARRGKLLSGVRLLPMGRLYRDGVDVYPDLLKELQRETDAAIGGVLTQYAGKTKQS